MKFPALYDSVEQTSRSSQREFLLSRASEFVLLVAAAGLGEMPRSAGSDVGPVIALVAFAVALVIRLSGRGDAAEKRWYDARAAAESIKSTSWQFAVGGEKFQQSDSSSAERFRKSLQEVLEVLPNLDVPAGPGARLAVTKEMESLRQAPFRERVKTYAEERIQDQQNWYSTRATANKKRARVWLVVLIMVEAGAVLLGLLRVVGLFDVNWLGVLAAGAASVAAWLQTKDYSSQSEAYSVTSHEVAILAETIDPETVDESDWGATVGSAETAFSREHTLWLARRRVSPK